MSVALVSLLLVFDGFLVTGRFSEYQTVFFELLVIYLRQNVSRKRIDLTKTNLKPPELEQSPEGVI